MPNREQENYLRDQQRYFYQDYSAIFNQNEVRGALQLEGAQVRRLLADIRNGEAHAYSQANALIGHLENRAGGEQLARAERQALAERQRAVLQYANDFAQQQREAIQNVALRVEVAQNENKFNAASRAIDLVTKGIDMAGERVLAKRVGGVLSGGFQMALGVAAATGNGAAAGLLGLTAAAPPLLPIVAGMAILSGAMTMFSSIQEEENNEAMEALLNGLNEIKQDIAQVRGEMHFRFDQIAHYLNTSFQVSQIQFAKVQDRFDQIDRELNVIQHINVINFHGVNQGLFFLGDRIDALARQGNQHERDDAMIKIVDKIRQFQNNPNLEKARNLVGLLQNEVRQKVISDESLNFLPEISLEQLHNYTNVSNYAIRAVLRLVGIKSQVINPMVWLKISAELLNKLDEIDVRDNDFYKELICLGQQGNLIQAELVKTLTPARVFKVMQAYLDALSAVQYAIADPICAYPSERPGDNLNTSLSEFDQAGRNLLAYFSLANWVYLDAGMPELRRYIQTQALFCREGIKARLEQLELEGKNILLAELENLGRVFFKEVFKPIFQKSCGGLYENIPHAVSNSTFIPQINGLIYQQVPGDGHCLYHAVGLYLGQEAAYLRRIVAAHIEANIENFREFIDLPDGITIESYITCIREGREWADNIDIEVLMRVTDRPIVVIGPDRRIRNEGVLERFHGDPIFVYYNGHTHYDALLQSPNAESKFGQKILSELTQCRENVASYRLNPYNDISACSQALFQCAYNLAPVAEILRIPVFELRMPRDNQMARNELIKKMNQLTGKAEINMFETYVKGEIVRIQAERAARLRAGLEQELINYDGQALPEIKIDNGRFSEISHVNNDISLTSVMSRWFTRYESRDWYGDRPGSYADLSRPFYGFSCPSNDAAEFKINKLKREYIDKQIERIQTNKAGMRPAGDTLFSKVARAREGLDGYTLILPLPASYLDSINNDYLRGAVSSGQGFIRHEYDINDGIFILRSSFASHNGAMNFNIFEQRLAIPARNHFNHNENLWHWWFGGDFCARGELEQSTLLYTNVNDDGNFHQNGYCLEPIIDSNNPAAMNNLQPVPARYYNELIGHLLFFNRNLIDGVDNSPQAYQQMRQDVIERLEADAYFNGNQQNIEARIDEVIALIRDCLARNIDGTCLDFYRELGTDFLGGRFFHLAEYCYDIVKQSAPSDADALKGLGDIEAERERMARENELIQNLEDVHRVVAPRVEQLADFQQQVQALVGRGLFRNPALEQAVAEQIDLVQGQVRANQI